MIDTTWNGIENAAYARERGETQKDWISE